MSVELTDREHQIIQQLILDRWNPHRINKKIANHHGLTINQVKYMRSKPAFKASTTSSWPFIWTASTTSSWLTARSA